MMIDGRDPKVWAAAIFALYFLAAAFIAVSVIVATVAHALD